VTNNAIEGYEVVPPGGRAAQSADDFLREFGAADGVALGLELLHDAVD
jgi:hypothetical protein